MKMKIKDIEPNPFKSQIDGGKLDEETINRIMSNIDELGLMGSLPIVQNDKHNFLVFGHHRIEALKRRFGIDYEINVEPVKYNEDQLLRGMIIENLTQRSNEFKQEKDNLLAIRKHLQDRCPHSGQRHKDNGTFAEGKCPGSIRDIARWLDKESGDVMKRSKIADILNIADNLDEDLQEDVQKQSHATGEKNEEDETIGVKVATALATFTDKKEQKDLAKAIKQSREQHGNKVTKNLTAYRNAPNEIKQKVRQLELDIADVEFETDKQVLNEKADSRPKTIFIPNFEQRMKQFNNDINKLERQVEIFSKIFHSKDFRERYNILKTNQQHKFNNVIFNIKGRIEKCYNEINFFMEKLEGNILVGEKE